MNSSADVADNLSFIERSLAGAQPIDLLVLPENFAQMPANRRQQYSERAGQGEVQDFLQQLTLTHSFTVVAGSLPIKEAENDKPYARCLIVKGGKVIHQYDKLHLFDVDTSVESKPGSAASKRQRYRESDTYQFGVQSEKIAPAHIQIGSNSVILGPSICYDLRFPELYRSYAVQGADIVTVPSAFTYETGKLHWDCLLRARAIENQAFVLAAGQVGQHANGRQTWGHSMMIDPLGAVLAQHPTKTGLLYADLDLHLRAELIRTFPVLSHRRLR